MRKRQNAIPDRGSVALSVRNKQPTAGQFGDFAFMDFERNTPQAPIAACAVAGGEWGHKRWLQFAVSNYRKRSVRSTFFVGVFYVLKASDSTSRSESRIKLSNHVRNCSRLIAAFLQLMIVRLN